MLADKIVKESEKEKKLVREDHFKENDAPSTTQFSCIMSSYSLFNTLGFFFFLRLLNI